MIKKDTKKIILFSMEDKQRKRPLNTGYFR